MTATPMPLIQQSQIIPNTSPNFTSAVVSTSQASSVIGANPMRRGITFANPSANTIYLAPAGPAIAIGQGIPLVPGGLYQIMAADNIQVNCGWQAIAAAGAANNLSILEFV